MKLKVCAICDVGKVRTNNEDMVLIGNKTLRDATYDAEIEVGADFVPFAVADGLGGAEGGEIASELVISMFSDFVAGLNKEVSVDEVTEKMDRWASVSNRIVLQRAECLGNKGMGTTLTGMLLTDNKAMLFNAGDSRVYRFRDGMLKQMTKDHSIRELTGDLNAPNNLMYNAFGSNNDFFIDIINLTGFIFEDDTFLICSDGLSDLVEEDTIEEIMAGEDVMSNLLKAAYEAGGIDNISLILIKVC